jgi:prenylcysteine oxidase/farnesylcysteine lyase
MRLVATTVLALLAVPLTIVAQKIAVIGGGISGSFVTKYLVDYDPQCQGLDSITVFDPFPPTQHADRAKAPDDDWQGSRVASVQLEDGTVVELGASIAIRDFHLVVDTIRNDPNLAIGKPLSTGSDEADNGLRQGMGIYDGDGQWALLTSTLPSYLRKFRILYRYNWDLLKVSRIAKQAQRKWSMLPSLFDSLHPDTFFDSPEDIWQAMGLENAVHYSFDRLLDVIHVPKDLSWWRKLLPGQGNLRSELLTVMNLVNYNQDTSQVNGFVGLGSFLAESSGMFSVKGGNYQIVQSAVRQAVANRDSSCLRKGTVKVEPERITTVVGSLEGLAIFAGEKNLGTFDIVILAAPLQQSRVNFLVQSHFDSAVVQPMPLAGLVNTHEGTPPEDHEGHERLPRSLPESAQRRYTQVVTTVVSNATLSADVLSLPEASMPRSVLMTTSVKASLHNITAITQLSGSLGGVYKVFSNDRLPDDVLRELFGQHCRTEYVKMWGGPFGGATPDYRGEGTSTNYLLFDGAVGFEGHTTSGALYYPSATEQYTLASMEISAVGARAVAKLVAKRLGLIESKTEEVRDEL